MKKLITLLLVLVSLSSYTQNDTIEQDLDEWEDSFNSSLLFDLDEFAYDVSKIQYDKDSLEYYFIVHLENYLDSVFPEHKNITLQRLPVLDSCAKHHTTYLTQMVNSDNPDKTFLVTHSESYESIGFKYVGNDTIIEDDYDRYRYYRDKMGFEEVQSDGSSLHFNGEILHVNNVGLITDYHYGVSHSDISEKILIGFLNSPPHKTSLHIHNNVFVGISILYRGTSMVCVVYTMNKYVEPNWGN